MRKVGRKIIDETGNRYGRLVVLRFAKQDRFGIARWRCLCDCGKEKEIRGDSLRAGRTQSCGCFLIERIRESKSLPRGEAAFNHILVNMKYGAKRRGHEWRLNKEFVRNVTQKPCYYCGASPSQSGGQKIYKNGKYIYNGIDRINNKIGYTIDNVVPCCGTCNVAKRSMTINRFKEWVSRIYRNFIEGKK